MFTRILSSFLTAILIGALAAFYTLLIQNATDSQRWAVFFIALVISCIALMVYFSRELFRKVYGLLALAYIFLPVVTLLRAIAALQDVRPAQEGFALFGLTLAGLVTGTIGAAGALICLIVWLILRRR